jgi:ethanolamine utilization microcompartment shell protein EutS
MTITPEIREASEALVGGIIIEAYKQGYMCAIERYTRALTHKGDMPSIHIEMKSQSEQLKKELLDFFFETLTRQGE